MEKERLRIYDEEDQIISSLCEIEWIEKNLQAVTPYKCGLPTIDEAINGFVEGEFIILSGRPKHGKSLTQRTFINNFYQRGALSCVFSYEEQPRYFYQNFPNGGRDILFYVPKRLKAFDIDWIIDRAIESKLKYETKIVFIDHGHYLFNIAEKNSTGAASDVARRLKRLAVDEGMIIFLIWHLMKVNVLSVSDLDQALIRDSGLICGEADSLLFTYRKVSSNGMVSTQESYITVDFARRTGAMKLVVPVCKDGYFFREIM